MPELPEVETMRRGIAAIAGSRIVAVEVTPSPRRPIAIRPAIGLIHRRLAGQTVAAVDRLGKRVVIRTGAGDRLILEPRMTGLVLTGTAPTVEHLRLRIRLRDREIPEVLFWDQRGLGVVTLMSSAEYEQKLLSGKIGPDACEISLEDFRQRVGATRMAIKPVLLDQGRVAGIGNLYASEMLHVAGIDPRLPARRLTTGQWRKLHAAMRKVLNQAIRFEGSTLADGTYRNSLNQAGNYQNCHRVYDRAGLACKRCGSGQTIQRLVQAQRSTFWCPGCQKKRAQD